MNQTTGDGIYFDLNVGGHHAGHPASYFWPFKRNKDKSNPWDVPGLEDGQEGEYLTDRLTDEAIKFIDANKDGPFLLFLSHYAVHTPIQSKEELTEKYKQRLNDMPETDGPSHRDEHGWSTTKLKQDNPAYAGMIESTDESVGRVMSRLEELGLEKDTAIIFMSDNGGLSTLNVNRKGAPTASLPLRAGKGWYYEGGIREPMIIKWPGVAKAGSVCSETVTSTDFYPTMLEMAGLKPKPYQHVDGLSLAGLLKGKSRLQREVVYWHSPHYHGSGNRPCGAIRAGDYKLIEWFEDGKVELYNLKDDIGEQNNLVERMPEKTNQLKKMLHKWRKEVDARMPVPNPNWKG